MTCIRDLSLALLLGALGGCATNSSKLEGGVQPSTSPKPRVVVTADPELDDSNSLVRYLLHSADFRTEGLV